MSLSARISDAEIAEGIDLWEHGRLNLYSISYLIKSVFSVHLDEM